MDLEESIYYAKAKSHAEARAKQLVEKIKQDSTYVEIPPEIDPFSEGLEKLICDVLIKVELINNSNNED